MGNNESNVSQKICLREFGKQPTLQTISSTTSQYRRLNTDKSEKAAESKTNGSPVPTKIVKRTTLHSRWSRGDSSVSVYSEFDSSGDSESSQSVAMDNVKIHELNEFGYCDETDSKTWGSWEHWETSSDDWKTATISPTGTIRNPSKVTARNNSLVVACRCW